jgi:hypothetical protein
MNENKMACCQRKEEILNKISTQGIPVMENISEWIKWTKSKKICLECKEFRADSLNAIDKSTAKEDKDAYIKKYFIAE